EESLCRDRHYRFTTCGRRAVGLFASHPMNGLNTLTSISLGSGGVNPDTEPDTVTTPVAAAPSESLAPTGMAAQATVPAAAPSASGAGASPSADPAHAAEPVPVPAESRAPAEVPVNTAVPAADASESLAPIEVPAQAVEPSEV